MIPQNSNDEGKPVLAITGVSKSFGGKPAVSNVSFQVKKGEIIGFLGPNGAGKTTTLRMALGLIKPDAGDIKLFGNPPGAAAFGRVGFLPEERGLYGKVKAREAIAHIAQLNGMGGREAVQRADEMLDKYGLGDAKHKKIKTLSKGMAQKVQLIAAIAHDPEFLILDEPFSGLDPVNQKLLEGMIREISGRGRTIIFSTHVMEHAERLCDTIVLMAGGQKIFDGSVAKTLSHAPRRLTIQAGGPEAGSIFKTLSSTMTLIDDETWSLVLKPNVTAQDVLKICMEKNIKLVRFEPKQASLHDAFVTLVANNNKAKG